MPDPLDPTRFHVLNTKNKLMILIVAIVLVVVVMPVLGVFYYKLAINRPAQTDKEMTFEIKSGESISQIANNLYQKGLINSEILFSMYIFINKFDRNIQAGTYTIRAGIPLIELVNQFQHGVNDLKITFLEGWRAEEYARLANEQFEKIDYSEFLRKAKPFEGYLFPDTYYFPKDAREDEMLAKLIATFEEKTSAVLTEDAIKKTALSKEQILIFASIVEREINNDQDRAIVAGILINRFKSGMRVDADATTQYAVAAKYLCGNNTTESVCAAPLEEVASFNWWPKNLTQEDLDSDSPFNTRKVVGLPPSPISNPGLASLRAVLNAKKTDYLFYITDKYGNAHYAKDLAGHEANIREFLQ